VDWRKQGAVSAVKDQGSCGSCWAFSATEEIESAVFMATKKLPDLSTQQIISCDKQDDGCNGGDPPTAYQYIKKAGGIDSASDYPDKSHTTGKTGKCVKHSEVDAKVTGWAYAVKPCNKGQCKDADETGLATALATKGPISICVNAGGNGWQVYKRGVFSKKCSGASSQLDHCVQLVGYDKTGDTPYWIVRNSWNTDWGIDGYMHLEMGKNLCGVADEATVVTATAAVQTVTV
jgi:C1A family cysteine protease